MQYFSVNTKNVFGMCIQNNTYPSKKLFKIIFEYEKSIQVLFLEYIYSNILYTIIAVLEFKGFEQFFFSFSQN